jgi:hypothetical protein
MRYGFNELEPPVGKYLDILQHILEPSSEVKSIDCCCGLGFGKTILGVQAAALTLNSQPGHVGLFLEPDWDRIENTFLPAWIRYVPDELYEIEAGKRRIIWKPTNGVLIYRPRVITGSRLLARSRTRGIETSFVIDDETAIEFDLEQYQNTFARIRLGTDIRYYLTLSTPLVGPYGRFLERGGNKVFTARTAENHYLLKRDPTYESRQRAQMSEQQARRELDAELVALEGRIWKSAKYDAESPDCAWPKGNRNDIWTSFRKGEPWYLFCDIGSSTGAYAVVQCMDAVYRGMREFDDVVWVAIADYCPDDDASASRAFQRLRQEYGIPTAVVGGADMNTASNTDGRTVAYFVENIFGAGVPIYPCSERRYHKQLQYDQLTYLMCTTNGERRFTIARDFVSLDPDSKRGIREMIDQDAWPVMEKRRPNEVLPKNKEILVQHIRDALLMGAVKLMAPPVWLYNENPAA